MLLNISQSKLSESSEQTIIRAIKSHLPVDVVIFTETMIDLIVGDIVTTIDIPDEITKLLKSDWVDETEVEIELYNDLL
jgi:hypothetical protein